MTLRLSALQCASPEGDIEAGFAALAPALRAAAAMGSKMLVAPETLFPGYNVADIAHLAVQQSGAWAERLSALCQSTGCGVTLGYAEKAQDAVYNAAIAIDAKGDVLGHYRKIQLYGPREAALYTAGSHYSTFQLEGRKAAILICYDIEFAPHVAALAARGVEIILVPTANMLPFTHVSAVTVPAMAANHGLSIVYANYCGQEGDLIYAGGSVIVGPHGETLALAGKGATLLVADLPAKAPNLASSQAADYREVSG